MKNVKVKIFEEYRRDTLEEKLNQFLNEEMDELDLIDIKLHVDPQVDPDWNVKPTYLAMVLYV